MMIQTIPDTASLTIRYLAAVSGLAGCYHNIALPSEFDWYLKF